MHSQMFHDKNIVSTDLYLGFKTDMQKDVSSHIFSHVYKYKHTHIYKLYVLICLILRCLASCKSYF